MVAAGRRAYPDVDLQVASLLDLPFADGIFAGVVLWYSTIHTAEADLPRLLAESVRVVRPSGVLLVGFQAGTGTQDLAESYGRHGHRVVLERHRRTPDQMATLLSAAGTQELARLVRAPSQPWEDDDQAFLLARRTRPPRPRPADDRPTDDRPSDDKGDPA